MAITYVGGDVQYDNASDTADLTLTLPVGTAENDVGILLVAECLTTGATIAPASGWTLVRTDSTTDADDRDCSIFYRVFGASESNPAVATSAQVFRSASLLVFSGVDTTTPVDVTALAQGTGDNPTNPAVTTTTDNGALVLWQFPTRDDVTTVGLPATPSGLILGPELHGSTRGNVQTIPCYLEDAGTAGTITPTAWTSTTTSSTAEYFCYTIALNASGGAPPAGDLERVYSGTTTLLKAYMGSTLLSKIYVGATQIYPSLGKVVNGNVDRQTSLLTDPNLVGWAMEGTGISTAPRTLELVDNLNSSGAGSLKNALELPNRWVYVDPALDGQVVNNGGSIINVGANTVYDGRDARLTLQQTVTGKAIMMVFDYGNNILHNLKLRGFGTSPGEGGGIKVNAGQYYWFDRVECTNMNEDAFGIGSAAAAALSANYVTVSRYKAYTLGKGLLLTGDDDGQQNNGRSEKFTVHSCDLAAKDRNLRSSGNRKVHVFNCYVHDTTSGTMDADHSGNNDNTNSGGTLDGSMFIESNVYENPPGSGNTTAERGVSRPTTVNDNVVFTTDNRIYYSTETGKDSDYGTYTPRSGNTTDIFTSGESSLLDIPPYTYTVLDKSAVKAHVLAEAGMQAPDAEFLATLT